MLRGLTKFDPILQFLYLEAVALVASYTALGVTNSRSSRGSSAALESVSRDVRGCASAFYVQEKQSRFSRGLYGSLHVFSRSVPARDVIGSISVDLPKWAHCISCPVSIPVMITRIRLSILLFVLVRIEKARLFSFAENLV